MGLAQIAAVGRSLLGVSVYQPPARNWGPSNADVDRIRRQSAGGNLSQQPYVPTRWYLSDLETAIHQANNGNMQMAADLMTAARSDGVVAGVLSTRTSGLVRLPKVFRGDPRLIEDLELGHDETRSIFDEMCPPSELSALAADGELLGVGIAELVPIVGRDYPLLSRLDPRCLRYLWSEGCWYYHSVAGLVRVTPGDGRWVLHTPGGRHAPWNNALWKSVGKAYIRKDHASAHKDSWEGKLAHPARVAISPQGAGEPQRQDFLQRLMAWSVNSVFGLSPGYDIKLIESNGRGYDSFLKTIEGCNYEITICIAGQSVTTDGGTGFANADIHRSIRADLIKATADGLSLTVNTQVIPIFVLSRYEPDALYPGAYVAWDVAPPKDRGAEAQVMVTTANGIQLLSAALAPYGIRPDVGAICARAGIPVLQGAAVLPEVQTSDHPDVQAPTHLREAA